VLEALLSNPSRPKYGYELSKVTGLKSGTIYPVLMRLTALGWLEAHWEPSALPGRPPRHAYHLTAVGRAAARQLLSPKRAKQLKPRFA
jgi:DNA-binding PadR family transcriptional regulator